MKVKTLDYMKRKIQAKSIAEIINELTEIIKNRSKGNIIHRSHDQYVRQDIPVGIYDDSRKKYKYNVTRPQSQDLSLMSS